MTSLGRDDLRFFVLPQAGYRTFVYYLNRFVAS